MAIDILTRKVENSLYECGNKKSLTTDCAQDELSRPEDGRHRRKKRIVNDDLLEEMIDERERRERSHPPIQRGQHQKLHSLNRIRGEKLLRIVNIVTKPT